MESVQLLLNVVVNGFVVGLKRQFQNLVQCRQFIQEVRASFFDSFLKLYIIVYLEVIIQNTANLTLESIRDLHHFLMELLPFRRHFLAHNRLKTAFVGEDHLSYAVQIALKVEKINEFEQHLRLVQFLVVFKLLIVRLSRRQICYKLIDCQVVKQASLRQFRLQDESIERGAAAQSHINLSVCERQTRVKNQSVECQSLALVNRYRPREFQRYLREASHFFFLYLFGLLIDAVLEILPCHRFHLNHLVATFHFKSAYLVIAHNPPDFSVEILFFS